MLQRSRVLLMATLGAFLVLFALLEAGLFYYQIVHPEPYLARADRYAFKPVSVPVPRGAIYDRKGEVLAASIPAVDVYASPKYLDNPRTRKNEREETVSHLVGCLSLDARELRDRLLRPGYRAVARGVMDPEVILQLYQWKQDGLLRGIDLEKCYRRYYPLGELMGHIIGFVDSENRGAFGVELLQDSLLQGRPGARTYLRDGVQNEIFSPFEDCEPGLPGGEVHLTIDSTLQFYAELELTRVQHLYHPKWAAAVVIAPSTGDILAAANLPGLDPSDPAKALAEEEEASHWMNRVFKAEYTPGSSFKPLVMAMAIDRGVLNLDERIDCEGGTWYHKKRRITDTHVDYRELDPAGVLIKSSNIGMSKIALRMVPEETRKGDEAFAPILHTLSLMGFGKRPGVLGEAMESPGRLSPLEEWTAQYTLVSISFGNEIAVTPIQMASAFSVLANGGVYVPPRLVKRTVSCEGVEVEPPLAPGCRVLSEATCREVTGMLTRVVDEGTGKKCRIPGVAVAGKTGTAEKLPARKEVTSSFVAYAPAERPALLVVVVVDEPHGAHYASTVAAPHVKAILERGLALLHLSGSGAAADPAGVAEVRE